MRIARALRNKYPCSGIGSDNGIIMRVQYSDNKNVFDGIVVT